MTLLLWELLTCLDASWQSLSFEMWPLLSNKLVSASYHVMFSWSWRKQLSVLRINCRLYFYNIYTIQAGDNSGQFHVHHLPILKHEYYIGKEANSVENKLRNTYWKWLWSRKDSRVAKVRVSCNATMRRCVFIVTWSSFLRYCYHGYWDLYPRVTSLISIKIQHVNINSSTRINDKNKITWPAKLLKWCLRKFERWDFACAWWMEASIFKKNKWRYKF